eukprot:997849-Alexandrium_andersonii.AAC.1
MSHAASPAVRDRHCHVGYHAPCDPTPNVTPPDHCHGGMETETTHVAHRGTSLDAILVERARRWTPAC